MQSDSFDEEFKKRISQVFQLERTMTAPTVSDESLQSYFSFLSKNVPLPVKKTGEHGTGLGEKPSALSRT